MTQVHSCGLDSRAPKDLEQSRLAPVLFWICQIWLDLAPCAEDPCGAADPDLATDPIDLLCIHKC